MGSVGAAEIEDPVVVVVAVTAEPPLELKVTFKVLADQMA